MQKLVVSIIMAFIFIFLLCSLLLLTLAHQLSHPLASIVAVVITLALIITFKTNKKRASTSIRPRESMFGDRLLQCYSMSLFASATNNFSNYNITYNGVYTIYRGWGYFNINAYVIYRWAYIPGDISKLRDVSHLTHPNLASMVGFCCSGGQMIVGYKNEGLGSLSYHLSYINYYNLSWLCRLKICIGAADALRRVHTAKLIHGGISPNTILVDSSFHAKLVTIGSFLGFLSVQDYHHRQHHFPPSLAELTEKSDVYMFGLLLFIVLCGKKTDYSGGYPFLLPDMVSEAMKTKTLHLIIDMNMMEISQNCMDMFLEVAFRCCSREEVHRPSMNAVVEGLRRAQALQIHNY